MTSHIALAAALVFDMMHKLSFTSGEAILWKDWHDFTYCYCDCHVMCFGHHVQLTFTSGEANHIDSYCHVSKQSELTS